MIEPDLVEESKLDEQRSEVVRFRTMLHRDTIHHPQFKEPVQHEEEPYHALLESLPQGVCVSQGNRIQFVNTAWLRLFGYTQPEEVLEQDVRMLFPAYDFQRWEACQNQLCSQESGPYRCEVQGIRRDKTAIWLETSLAHVVWQHTSACLATFVDITEHRRMEVQLRQAQKSQTIGILAGGIAHDFNNMLSAILGFAELAMGDVPQDSVAWRRLQRVLTAGERAKDLVHQILAFSRQNEQTCRPVQIKEIVTEVMKLLRASLPTTIAIQQDCTGVTGTVLADPTHIHQVLLNLCVNAEYAMRNKGGTLTIQLEEVDVTTTSETWATSLVPGPYIRLMVRDTGDGMPAEVLERAFEPFFTTKAEDKGTGLGLAVVQGIIRSYQGAIDVQSTPGQGTTFWVYFPRVAPHPHAISVVDEPIPGGQERVLFVDDEELLVRLGRAMLERLGYEATVATGSYEALELFRQAPERFDLVITDQTMPGMTGDILAQALRGLRPDLPIILCTGFSHTMNAEKAQSLGINAFLLKPVLLRDLGLTIRRVLER